MNLADLASIASIVSSAAVAVSLLYLGLQVHQNTKHTRALIHQGRSQRAVGVHLNFAEPHMAEAWLKAEGRVPTPEEISRRQFWLLGIAYDLSWEDTFLQHEMGLLAEDQFVDFRAKLIEILQHKGLREYFSNRSVPPEGRTKYHHFLTDVLAKAAAAKT